MSYEITLLPFGITFECDEEESILEASLRQGFNLRYGCKHGGCGACKAQISEGEVDVEEASTFALMDYERSQGLALLCSAYPLSDVSIELADDYEEADLRSGVPIIDLRARVAEEVPVSRDIWQLRLDLIEPGQLDFRAGQYVEVLVPGTDEWRAFSMANPPSSAGRIDLLIKILPGGLFSEHLASEIAPGDELDLRGPYGQFSLTQSQAPIVMIAGGSGMAPIWSMLHQLVDEASTRPITFFYGARGMADLFWLDELEQLKGNLSSFEFVPALSEPETGDGWDGETGLVTEVLDRCCDNLRGSEAYLCGPPGMIDAAIGVLREKGLFSSHIRFDKFVETGG